MKSLQKTCPVLHVSGQSVVLLSSLVFLVTYLKPLGYLYKNIAHNINLSRFGMLFLLRGKNRVEWGRDLFYAGVA